MFFAAKEAVERRAFQRGQRAGISRERARIARLLAEHGVAVSPDLARYLADDLRDERDD